MPKCRVCKEPFEKRQSFQTWCSPEHAYIIATEKLAKVKKTAARADRVKTRAKLASLEPIGKAEKRAEAAVNEYVRHRDHYKRLGCVSCDKPWDWVGRWNASHFRSVGAATAVRFNLWNIARSCWICNQIYSGKIDQYEPVLVQRIGQERVDWLKSQNQITRYSREYLERLRAIFTKKTRRLLARMDHES